MSIGKTPPLLHQQLARELSHLRSLAGLDQREIGRRINLSQPMVSRAERAEKLLPLPKVVAWGKVCGASQETLDRLSALTEAAFTQAEAWRDLMPEFPRLQDAVRANEATTRVKGHAELYRDIYRRLWSTATVGPDAVNLIQGVAAELRG